MEFKDVKVDQIYKFINKEEAIKSCGMAKNTPGVAFIKVTSLLSANKNIRYDLLDKNKNKLGSCYVCIKPKDIEPIVSVRKVKSSKKALDSLVLENSIKQEILAVLNQHNNAETLFKDWGLGETIEYGKGTSFLFYGPPGTGKTWAAHCISKYLGQELLIVSPAEIQTSEPGGANRAIKSAFQHAKEQNKVLFIDECDGLISDRTHLGMVLGGEINTLLTEIELFEGVLILATNLVKTLDKALERRISLIVEFKEPDFEQRKSIWQSLLPKKMPTDVTPEQLAEFKLTGGLIKNALIQAARLAISDKAKAVEAKHFEQAITRVLASQNILGTESRYQSALKQVNRSVSDVDIVRQ